MLCLPRITIQFDDVEWSQAELIALRIVCQCCCHIATTWTSFFTRQIELSCNRCRLYACCLHGFGKGIKALERLCLLFTAGIQHKHLAILPEHHLQVSVDFLGDANTLTFHTLFQLCALYEHELASYILLIVNGGLNEFLFHCYSALSDFNSMLVRRRMRAYFSPSTRPSRKAR